MSSQSPRVVAVVDDDPAVCDSLRFLLEIAGHAVKTYSSAARFLAEAEPAGLGCLVLDQQMPQLTGLDLLAQLRSQGVATPTLLMVSTPASAVSQRAAALGVYRVLEKPFAQDELLSQIETLVA